MAVIKGTFSCVWCGKEFERSLKQIREATRRGSAGPFCSHSCVARWSHSNQQPKGFSIGTFTCVGCGKEFQRKMKYQMWALRHGLMGPFCGQSCAAIWRATVKRESPPLQHGKPSAYRRGCRCEECVTYKREASRRYCERIKLRPRE